MSRRIWILAALLAATALAASAAPAFSGDSGSIVGTVSVPAPPAPCIQLSTTSLDFGTQAFATNGAHVQAGRDFSVTNCSPAVSQFTIAGTNATGPGGVWSLTDNWFNCDGTLNRYGLRWDENEAGTFWSGGPLITTPRVLGHVVESLNQWVMTWNPGDAETERVSVEMPCAGSNGAGQQFSFSIGLIATVA
jgi:hypothetical protein